VCALATTMPAEQLSATLPATPLWSGRDLLAHLVGVSVDVLAGNMEGAVTPPWTAAQIERRKDRSVPQLVAEWDESGPRIESMIADRSTQLQMVHDVLVHEGDLREAHGLGSPPESDVAAMLAVFGKLLARIHAERPGGVLLRAGGKQWRLGAEPAASVEVEPHELYRGLFSRRSRAQLRAWPWQGDPGEFVDLLPVFGPREDDQPVS
jgi:uncharacterized protein (TIGR03083 family)